MFSSLDSAKEHGFHWLEYRPDLGVHLVEKSFSRTDGKLAKAMAFAKPEPAKPSAN